MKIETKCNIGDEVWFMENNKPTTMKVWDITIEIKTKYDGQYTYGTYHRVYYHDFGYHHTISEGELFPTKEELLKSL